MVYWRNMENPSTHEIWQKEVKYLEDLKRQYPDKFVPLKGKGSEVLEEIGIYIFKNLPEGYIKILPYDFIVEEITLSGRLVSVDKQRMMDLDAEKGFVHADLIKTGISTMDAVREIAKHLSINEKDITYAGLKDGGAVTAQEISFRNVKKEVIAELSLPQMDFKNVHIEKGMLTPGSLSGNRFTILVRSEVPYHSGTFMERVENIKKNGMYNFYGPQRFGAPRYISHFLGHAITRNDFAETVKIFLCKVSEFEYPYFTDIRNTALRLYGQWEKMKQVYINLPYTFRLELKLLDSLINHNNDPEKYKYYNALREAMPDQIDFWVKSYASFLFNEYISQAVLNSLVLPPVLPLLVGGDERLIQQFYGQALQRDNVTRYKETFSHIREIRTGNDSKAETRIMPVIHNALIIGEGFLFSFDLPKGAYATTLIGSLVSIEHSEQYLKHIQPEFVDTKKLLNTGSLQERFLEFNN